MAPARAALKRTRGGGWVRGAGLWLLAEQIHALRIPQTWVEISPKDTWLGLSLDRSWVTVPEALRKLKQVS